MRGVLIGAEDIINLKNVMLEEIIKGLEDLKNLVKKYWFEFLFLIYGYNLQVWLWVWFLSIICIFLFISFASRKTKWKFFCFIKFFLAINQKAKKLWFYTNCDRKNEEFRKNTLIYVFMYNLPSKIFVNTLNAKTVILLIPCLDVY